MGIRPGAKANLTAERTEPQEIAVLPLTLTGASQCITRRSIRRADPLGCQASSEKSALKGRRTLPREATEARRAATSCLARARSFFPSTRLSTQARKRPAESLSGGLSVKDQRSLTYPATKGNPGGKLPDGKGAFRSPRFKISAAERKAATNQEYML